MFKAKSSKLRCADHHLNYGLLVMRLAIGVIFILHGYGKLFGNAPGMEAFTGMLAGIGVPAAAFSAYLVGIIEFVGGIAVLLGIFTRVFAPLITIVMLVAFFTVKQGLPAGDADLALFAITFALTFTGPGTLSLAGLITEWKEKKSNSVTTPSQQTV